MPATQPAPIDAEFLAFALRLADTSRALTLESIANPPEVQTKDDMSPVTAADQRIEHELRRLIGERYPEHGILGEEYASERLDAEYIWVIDPIDGTKAFITGMPVFGTLISLTRNGAPFLGIIDHPVTSERWVGLNGQPSTLNGESVCCRQRQNLAEAIVSIGNPESLSSGEALAFQTLRARTKWGLYGGNCYAYGRLASGTIDISLDSGLDPFDFCALAPVVHGAGGVMTDWEGQPLTIHSGQRVIASCTPEIHRQAVEILRDA